MAQGLARQVKSWYPAAQSYNKYRFPTNIGSVLVYFDQQLERYVFSPATKNQFHHKPTYESVLASLHELREIVTHAGVQHLSPPNLSSGYDNLDFNIVFELICQIFEPLPQTTKLFTFLRTHRHSTD